MFEKKPRFSSWKFTERKKWYNCLISIKIYWTLSDFYQNILDTWWSVIAVSSKTGQIKMVCSSSSIIIKFCSVWLETGTYLFVTTSTVHTVLVKVIYPKYSKHLLSTVPHTLDCVCSKILNHGLLFSLFRFFEWKNILD